MPPKKKVERGAQENIQVSRIRIFLPIVGKMDFQSQS
jgi:hypothetical protein